MYLTEKFVARVFAGGKITIPLRLRQLSGGEDGDYVRLAVLEVVKHVDRQNDKGSG